MFKSPVLDLRQVLSGFTFASYAVYMHLYVDVTEASDFFVPRRKSKGTVVMGSPVGPSVSPLTSLVSATPTVFKGF